MAKSLQVSKLEEILQKELNTTKLKPLGFATGGCINEGQSYLTENGKIFVKVNEKSEVNLTYSNRGESPSLCQTLRLLNKQLVWFSFQTTKMFEGEFLSLETIYPTNTVRVPKPIKVSLSSISLEIRNCSKSLNLRKSFLILREKFKTNHRIRTLLPVIKAGSLNL